MGLGSRNNVLTMERSCCGQVVHARMKDTGVEYAVKIMEKRFIRKEKKVKFVMMERKVFSKVTHDRIVKLFFTFQVGMPKLSFDRGLAGWLVGRVMRHRHAQVCTQ